MIPIQTQLPTWTAVTPTLLLALTALVLFLVDSIDPDSTRPTALAGIAALGSVSALAVAGWFLLAGTGQTGSGGAIELYGGSIVVDGMSLFFTVIFASVAAMVSLASYDYLRDRTYQAEFYSLVMLAATGMSLMGSSGSLATVFVSLELASLPSYALVAFLKKNRGSVEAGLKYFLVGAVSSAVFAFGISLIYAVTGSLLLSEIAADIGSAGDLVGVAGIGIVMIAGGFAFKTASVPFHFWAPEAYEGAPAPISAFLSSASKAAGFAVAFRVFAVAFPIDSVVPMGIDWPMLFAVLAVVTMTLGNFAAATQENVKRMLAYSSVGHAGYVLIGLASLGGVASQGDTVLGASMMHLFVYGFMNTGAFLFIALVEYWGVGRTFEDYAGLGRKAPVACAAMTVFLFSLAGLPIGGGFFSKFYLFSATLNVGAWSLAAALVINSALSLFYYSRVVKAMWFEEPTGERTIESYPTGLYTAIVAAAVITVLLIPGFSYVSDIAFRAVELL